ncbi:MAG: class I SAM-dependent methyltransferase [Defluviitaleaceae bacterium]|nr:class I SAM-dependent methyltransferase [Defluviitaleaceae bacterium]
MNYDSTNKEGSKRIFLKKHLLYPNERVVAFLAQYYGDIQNNANLKGLDIGCAQGRHIELMLDYGFQAHGVDYVEDACDFCRKLISSRNAKGEIYCGDFSGHYEDETFDVMICLGTIFLRQIDDMKRDLADLFSILKTGGRFFVNFRTHEDSLYGKGKQIDEFSFLLDERSKEYNGILYTFLTYEQAEKLLIDAGFTIDRVERVELWKNNLESRHTWWNFILKK